MNYALERRARRLLCRAVRTNTLSAGDTRRMEYWKELQGRQYYFTNYDCESCMTSLLRNLKFPVDELTSVQRVGIGRDFFTKYLPSIRI